MLFLKLTGIMIDFATGCGSYKANILFFVIYAVFFMLFFPFCARHSLSLCVLLLCIDQNFMVVDGFHVLFVKRGVGLSNILEIFCLSSVWFIIKYCKFSINMVSVVIIDSYTVFNSFLKYLEIFSSAFEYKPLKNSSCCFWYIKSVFQSKHMLSF